jgi:hypothetical protein
MISGGLWCLFPFSPHSLDWPAFARADPIKVANCSRLATALNPKRRHTDIPSAFDRPEIWQPGFLRCRDAQLQR